MVQYHCERLVAWITPPKDSCVNPESALQAICSKRCIDQTACTARLRSMQRFVGDVLQKPSGFCRPHVKLYQNQWCDTAVRHRLLLKDFVHALQAISSEHQRASIGGSKLQHRPTCQVCGVNHSTNTATSISDT